MRPRTGGQRLVETGPGVDFAKEVAQGRQTYRRPASTIVGLPWRSVCGSRARRMRRTTGSRKVGTGLRVGMPWARVHGEGSRRRRCFAEESWAGTVDHLLRTPNRDTSSRWFPLSDQARVRTRTKGLAGGQRREGLLPRSGIVRPLRSSVRTAKPRKPPPLSSTILPQEPAAMPRFSRGSDFEIRDGARRAADRGRRNATFLQRRLIASVRPVPRQAYLDDSDLRSLRQTLLECPRPEGVAMSSQAWCDGRGKEIDPDVDSDT